VALTLSPSVTVTDVDNLNLASATVSITGGTFAADGDVLAANTTGTAITASYNSSTETLTLTGSDTLAHYSQVLDTVTFDTTAADPSNGGSNPTRTISWVLNDGSGSFNLSTAQFTTVTVQQGPNVAPQATAAYTENAAPSTLSSSVGLSDTNGTVLVSATVAITGGTFMGDGDVLGFSTTGTSITASYNSSTETLVLTGSDTLAHYSQVLDSVTFVTPSDNPDDYGSAPTRLVTWTVNDGAGSHSTATATSTINITAVNDAPTLKGAGDTSFTENGSAVTLSGAASVSDPDNLNLANATVQITGGAFTGDGDVLGFSTTGTSITASYSSSTETLTLTGSDTLAHYSQVLDSVTFVTPSHNPDDFGSAPIRAVTWTLNDGSASNATTSVTTTVSITAVNDAPTLSSVAAMAAFTENGAAVTLAGATSVSDPDNANLASATVKIIGGSFAGDGDALAANVSATSITASYNAATETLTLTGSDTLAHYQQVLDSLTFNSTSLNPTNYGSDTTRTVTWALDDGSASNHLSTVQTTTISITPINDAPTLTGAGNTSFTENGSAVTLSGSASVSDPDDLNLASATVAITGGAFAGDRDVLGFSTTGTSITASYNSSTETLTLTGSDTLAHYSQVLDSVTFATTSDNPDDFGSAPTRTVTWTLDDGSASNVTTSVTTTVSITAVNDPPTLAGVAATAAFIENGAAVTLAGAASVSDPDNANLASATVKIAGGSFAGDGDVLAANVSGTSITASYNAATETLTLTGSDTLAHYQQALDSLTFNATSLNPTNYASNTTRTVTWALNDGSGSNNLSTTATTTVSLTPVNDAPSLTSVVGVTSYTENAASITVSPSITVSDPDNLNLANATVSISNTFAGDGDVLSANTAGTSITASYNSSTETLTLTGSDTVAHSRCSIRSLSRPTATTRPTTARSSAACSPGRSTTAARRTTPTRHSLLPL
jgi:lipopolysaccharide export system protein LptA